MSLADRFGTHQNSGGGFGQGSLARRFGSQDDEWEERGILLVNKRTGETKPKPIPGGKPAYEPEPKRSFLGLAGSALSEDVKLLGAGMAETAAGLGEFATGESGFGPSRVARELGQKISGLAAPSPMKAASSAIRGYAGERVSRLGEIGAEMGVGPLAAASHAAGVRTGGQLIDILPLGRLSRTPAQALQRGLAPRSAPTPTQALDPDLIGLQRASLAIGESPASGRLPIHEIVREGNTLTAEGANGETLGSLDVLPEPGGGFRVANVVTGRRGSGVGRALYRRAAEEFGTYRGSAAQTPEGEGFVARLRETDPEVFGDDLRYGPSATPEPPRRLLDEPPAPQAPSAGRQPGPLAPPSRSGEAGHVRAGGLKDWLESNLLSGGPFRAAARGFARPEQREFVRSIPRAIEGAEGRVAARVQAARYAIRDLEEAVRASTANNDEAAQLYSTLYDVRLRRRPWREVPEEVRPFARALFKIVDRTSVEMRDSGAVPPSLRDVVTRRLGRYFHRGYAAFDDPRWRERVEGGEAWREAEGFLRSEFPDATPGEIQGILNALTDRERGVRRFLVTGGAPARVNVILQRRQAIPEPLRRVMGEYTDVRQVAEKTIESMAYDLETYRLLRGLRDEGEALNVFRRSGNPEDEVYRAILGPDEGDFGDRHPLSDMLTTPGLKRAITGAFEEAKYTTWNKMAGWVKAAKTVGSVQTHARNFLSHTITSVANGRNPVNPNRWSQVRGLFADRAQRLRSIELGILGEGAMSREVSDYLRMVENPEAPLLVRGAVRGGKALQRLYRLEDDLWRAYNWLGETEDLMRARGLDLATAQAEAADRVRNTFQTYGRAPQVAERLRRNPLFGAFPTFYIESVRNVGNIARIGLGDLREGMRTGNSELVKLGVRRFVGLATGALAATGLGTLGRAKTGMTDEQEAAFRRQVAPHYLRNAELVFTDYVPGSEAQVFDFSFMNPYSGISKSAIATMRALDEGKVPLQAVTEFLEQVAGTEILASSALELGMNRRIQDTLPPRVGGEVYSTDMGPTRMWGDIGYEAYRNLAPGAALTVENVARGAQGATGAEFLPTAQVSSGIRRELGTELLAVAGPRVTTFNMETAFKRRIRDIGDRYGKVAGRTKSEAKRVGPEPSVARDYATGTVNLWRELDQIVKDARTLEVPEGVLVEAMRDARLARWFRSSFLGELPDVPPGIEVDPETYDLIRQAYSRRRGR